jgi:hypothetical protein
MTEADLKDFLEANKAEINKAVKDATIKQLLEEYRWPITDTISQVVTEFIKTEIVPEVKAALVGEKSAIVDAAIKACADISDTLAKGLMQDAAKNVGSEYRRKQIVDAIFK